MIFKKSKSSPIPPLANLNLEFNITAISKWVADKKSIPPDQKWNNDDVTKNHLITMLPMDPFLFYHNDVNEYSPAIAGSESIADDEVYAIEWQWTHSDFVVTVNNERHIIFLVPLEEILYLLKNRHPIPISDNARKDMDGAVINIDSTEKYCRQIYKEPFFRSGIIFSNSLVKFSVVYTTASNVVLY